MRNTNKMAKYTDIQFAITLINDIIWQNIPYIQYDALLEMININLIMIVKKLSDLNGC